MKKRFTTYAVLVAIAVMLVSCRQSPVLESTTTETTTEQTAEQKETTKKTKTTKETTKHKEETTTSTEVVEETEEYIEETEEYIEETEEYIEETTEILEAEAEPETELSADDLLYNGVVYWNGWRFTWYSENVLPGGGLDIPGRWSDGNFVRDIDGYICVASSDLDYGTVIDTPWGAAKVYDCGCDSGTIDVYTSF